MTPRSNRTGRPQRVARDIRQPRSLLQNLESRLLLSSNPTGNVELFTAGSIGGWARDADTVNQSITVRVTIDGHATDITASTNRPDLAAFFHDNGNYGFTFAPNLTPGSHNVTVQALDPQTNVAVTLKQGVLVNNAPIGNADIISSTRVAGWAFDKDIGSGPVTIRIDSNGQTVTTVQANIPRPDLTGAIGSPNHGFDVSGNFGVVDVYAQDNSGTWVLIKSTNKAPKGNVEVLTKTTASGWVFDPDNAAGPVTVVVKVDGQVAATTTANLERPDVASVTGGSTAHGFIANFLLTPGTHKVEVFAEEGDTSSVKEVLLGTSGSVSNPPPTGSMDSATTQVVTGWAFDPDAGANPLTIQVFVDGTLNATGTANISRPDIVKVTGSPNHGYSIALNNVSVSPHRIQIFALDNPTGTAVKIADKVIGNTAPIGNIDIANPTTIVGWALDPDDKSATLQIIPVLDGTAYPAAPAGDNRPDLQSVFGSANHGFTYAMPTHLFGQHKLQLVAVDSFDGTTTVVRTLTFTNNAPVGNIDFAGGNGVAGWTFDKDDPTKSIDILIKIDGTIVARATANVNRPDLASVTGGSTAHGFSVAFSNMTKGQHTIIVYAVDPATGVTQSIGTKVINV